MSQSEPESGKDSKWKLGCKTVENHRKPVRARERHTEGKLDPKRVRERQRELEGRPASQRESQGELRSKPERFAASFSF